MDYSDYIRTIPDYPKPGILFRDVTTLLSHAEAFQSAVAALCAPFEGLGVTQIAGIDARGFILGGAMATHLGAGFTALRKPGKLPWHTYSENYQLEYGQDTLHMHDDALCPTDKVVLVDDLIATGGTAEAGLKLLKRSQADILAGVFLIDLPDLGGADRLRAYGLDVHALMQFSGH